MDKVDSPVLKQRVFYNRFQLCRSIFLNLEKYNEIEFMT